MKKTPTSNLFRITNESVKYNRLAASSDFKIKLGNKINKIEKDKVIKPITTNIIDNSYIDLLYYNL